MSLVLKKHGANGRPNKSGFDVDIPQELEDLVDGKIQTVEWEDEPNVEDIYENDATDAWEEWEDIDVEDLYDLVESKAGGNDTPIVARIGSYWPSRRPSYGN